MTLQRANLDKLIEKKLKEWLIGSLSMHYIKERKYRQNHHNVNCYEYTTNVTHVKQLALKQWQLVPFEANG